MTGLSNFGDLAVLLPLSLVILLWLLMARLRNAAGWWLIASAFCIVGTAVLKIYLFACPLADNISSPSGHSSLSTLVYGAFVVIGADELANGWRQKVVIASGAGIILAIALSRIFLGAHGVVEILLGLMVGTASLAVFARGYLRSRAADAAASLRGLAVVAVALMVMLHGRELRAEELLHTMSQYLGIGLIMCGR
jgi:membrane-associated phospholipid phosphatase